MAASARPLRVHLCSADIRIGPPPIDLNRAHGRRASSRIGTRGTWPRTELARRVGRLTIRSMYRSLNAALIVQTIAQLNDRIQERFPQSGLGKVAAELQQIGNEAVARSDWIARPLLPLRVAIAALVLLVGAIVLLALANVNVNRMWESFSDFVQAVDAGINDVVFVGIAIFFLVTLEARIKRRRALKDINELRSLAHIIDMHQLTKDPHLILSGGPATPSSPKRTMTAFEMSRYLDYCSEMLSLIGKVAALYVQRFNDPVALSAVDEIEDLTTGLARKIWQKIVMINQDKK